LVRLVLKGVVHFKKKMLIIYSSPCHPRCPCLSFFIRKEIKVFDENIPGFSLYNGLYWEPNDPNESFSAASKALNDSRH